MSDQNPDVESQPATIEATISHIGPVRSARILFKGGEAGWGQNSIGEYVRMVRPPAGDFYTERDYGHCLKLLRGEFAIDVIDSIFSPETMKFVIAAEDMDLLRQDGIGKTSAGKLLSFETSPIASDVRRNDPMAVLQENLRLAVHERHEWHDTLKHRLVADDQRECEIVLSESFLRRLEQKLPPHSGENVELIRCVVNMLGELLPEIPVAVEVERGRQAKITIAVKDVNYEKLDAVLAQAKQGLGNTVASIMSARRNRAQGGGELKR